MSKLAKAAIILGILFFVCIGISCTLFFTAINPSDIKSDVLNNEGVVFNKSKVYEINEQHEAELSGITLVKIKSSTNNIRAIESDDDLFYFIINGTIYDLSLISKKVKFELIKTGNTLEFKESNGWMYVGFGQYFKGEIIIKVPKTYEGSLDIDVSSGNVDVSLKNSFNELKLETSSGKITIDNIVSKSTNIETSSGQIAIANLNTGNTIINTSSGAVKITKLFSDNLTTHTSSGSIKIAELEAKDLDISTSSGSTNIDKLVANDIKVNSSSGKVELGGSFNKLNVDMSSGIVNIMSKKMNADYNIKLSSGRFNLTIPQDTGFKITGDINSGSIKNNITGEKYSNDFSDIVNGGGYTMTFKVSSGTVQIN